MNNNVVILSNEAKELLAESTQPTTIAAEVEVPPIPVEETPTPAPPAEPAAPIEAPAKKKVKMSDTMLQKFCKSIVSMVDFLQDMGFNKMVDNKLNKKVRQAGHSDNYLYMLLQKESEADANFNAEEKQLLDLFKRAEKYRETIPFDEDEEDDLAESLFLYMKEKGYEFSPEMLLLVNIISILTPKFVGLKML